jgi:hypothetical protein
VGNRLIHLVKDPLSLRGLPTTPLTLVLVAALYERGHHEVPANLTELFSKYVELALGRWDETKDISSQFEWKVKQFILQQVSWDMYQQGQIAITPDYFETTVKRIGVERALDINADIFSKEIITRSQLLIQNSNGEFEFKHRSFQEFFVGTEINSRSDAVQLIVSNFFDPQWSGTIFFASGLRPGSEEYLRAILDQVFVPAGNSLYFAVNLGYLTQAAYLAPKQVKLEAVNSVLRALTDAWNHFSKFYADAELENIPVSATHIPSLAFFTAMAKAALGSITLSPVLSDLAKNYCSQPIEGLSESERAVKEWHACLLAVACSWCGDVNSFVALSECGLIQDPGLLLICKTEAELLQDYDWFSKADRKRVDELSKGLQKKLGRRKEYLKALRDILPIPLSESDET